MCVFKNSENFDDDSASISTSRSTPFVPKASGSGIAKRNRLNSSAQSESVSSIASTALQRALQTLEAPSDDWDTFGDYVSAEMQELSKLDGAQAGRLKRQINKLILNAFDEREGATSMPAVQLSHSTPSPDGK